MNMNEETIQAGLRGLGLPIRYVLGRLELAQKRRRGPDPWGLSGSRAQFRYRATNALLREQFGTVGSILELGCGEGHQSVHLIHHCRRLHGIDEHGPSIERAKERVPGATFQVANLDDMAFDQLGGPFDLVTGFECIYYCRDIRPILTSMSRVARFCVVSTIHLPGLSLAHEFARLKDVQTVVIRSDDAAWTFAWWPGQGF
jgi:2-polyprenyl-3-methyl-5-hydroxy-6-metoxy-1,4-benzoquinol methylase